VKVDGCSIDDDEEDNDSEDEDTVIWLCEDVVAWVCEAGAEVSAKIPAELGVDCVFKVNTGGVATVCRVVAEIAAGEGAAAAVVGNESLPQRHKQSQAPFDRRVPAPDAIAPDGATESGAIAVAVVMLVEVGFRTRELTRRADRCCDFR
jgi:hypothetical protein